MRPKASDFKSAATLTRLLKEHDEHVIHGTLRVNVQVSNDGKNTSEENFKALDDLVERGVDTSEESTEGWDGDCGDEESIKGGCDVL